MSGSLGHQPCTELETRAGTWRYDANKTDQHFSPAERYVTGLRNGGADGVPRPRDYEVPMPPKAEDSDVTAVAAYVWSIGHTAHH